MKKKILVLGLLLVLISGCKNKEETITFSNFESIKVNLSYKANKSIEIDDSILSEKISTDSFILYIYTNGCSSCEMFESRCLNPYITSNLVDIYKIDYSKLNNLIPSPSSYQTNPRLVFISNGNIVNQISINQDEKLFNDPTYFTNYLDSHIIKSNRIVINDANDINELINSNSVIYYGWKACGDCSYLERHEMINIDYDSSYSSYYYFDVDEYRKDGNNTNKWSNFVDMTLMNINSNLGKVPTIIKYNNSNVADYVIYFNDILDTNNDKIKVIQTSYNDSGNIVGKEFDTYLDYQNQTNSYHKEKLLTFFNNYVR